MVRPNVHCHVVKSSTAGQNHADFDECEVQKIQPGRLERTFTVASDVKGVPGLMAGAQITRCPPNNRHRTAGNLEG
jgi:hypothetical protein